MNVLVNGIGNIGTTLLYLLQHYKKELAIDHIYALKNTPMPWHNEDLSRMQQAGIQICTRKTDEYIDLNEIINKVDYLFDCTNNGGGIANKEWYESLSNLKGASAQGSEKNFGVSFMSGINNEAIANEKYAHIVSCNTHSIASLLITISGMDLDNVKSADFVIVRRSEDIGNHQRLVSANVVARHLDPKLGTHHSIDVIDLFSTINKEIDVTSSDVTTPSQLMHGVRFNIELEDTLTSSQLYDYIDRNPYVATSNKFDSNVIFELGRRHGFQGRIYSHAIIISNNIILKNNRVIGWAFIPQEGNTLISTIHAFLLQSKHPDHERILVKLMHELTESHW